MMTVRVRFAPSPTGSLHIGNARTALFNWLFARHHGGVFILRVEDTDVVRSSVTAEVSIYRSLRWLGLNWDEGPDRGGPVGPYRQSQRLERYRSYAQWLLEHGWAYYCFCPEELLERERQAMLRRGVAPRYPGTCRRISQQEAEARRRRGEPAAIRFRVDPTVSCDFEDLIRGPVRASTATIGDFIILRANGMPAYNFAAVVDDHEMAITHVIRGEDHLSNTHRQILLYRALGWTPPAFAHLPMVLGPDGKRLSKRHGAASIEDLAARGYPPAAVFNYLALLGWSSPDHREILSREDLIVRFDLTRVGRAGAVFDEARLRWMAGVYVRDILSDEEVWSMVEPFVENYVPANKTPAIRAWLVRWAASFRPHLTCGQDILNWLGVVFDYDPYRIFHSPEARAVVTRPEAERVLKQLYERLQALPPPIHPEQFRAVMRQIQDETGLRGRALWMPVRVALTTHTQGPEMDRLIELYESGEPLLLPRPVLGVHARLKAFWRVYHEVGKGKAPVR